MGMKNGFPLESRPLCFTTFVWLSNTLKWSVLSCFCKMFWQPVTRIATGRIFQKLVEFYAKSAGIITFQNRITVGRSTNQWDLNVSKIIKVNILWIIQIINVNNLNRNARIVFFISLLWNCMIVIRKTYLKIKSKAFEKICLIQVIIIYISIIRNVPDNLWPWPDISSVRPIQWRTRRCWRNDRRWLDDRGGQERGLEPFVGWGRSRQSNTAAREGCQIPTWG